MATYKLVSPGPEHKKRALQVLDEFKGVFADEYAARDRDVLGAFYSLRIFDKFYKDWLEYLETERQDQAWIPRETLFLIRDEFGHEQIIGALQVYYRANLRGPFRKWIGHFRYTDRPSERKNWLNHKVAFFLAMYKLKEHGICQALALDKRGHGPITSALLDLGGKEVFRKNYQEQDILASDLRFYTANIDEALAKGAKTLGQLTENPL